MPWQDPDPGDPQVLVGVTLPPDPEALRDMAYAFAEELARMGLDQERIVRIFATPFYAGAHRAWRGLGPAGVRTIVAECVAVFGRHRHGGAAAPPEERD
jgi:hypothetical protein